VYGDLIENIDCSLPLYESVSFTVRHDIITFYIYSVFGCFAQAF